MFTSVSRNNGSGVWDVVLALCTTRQQRLAMSVIMKEGLTTNIEAVVAVERNYKEVPAKHEMDSVSCRALQGYLDAFSFFHHLKLLGPKKAQDRL